ncbi:MAG: 1-acyl-sn-glycerol-3-phosphate acyltransferase [Saprospiraceae bacterium]|nr:1-acyl-sn-glycerol-3-phosphate acyltransferase [Saprospiraceae bacterium]
MLYQILKPIVKYAIRVFFKKTYFYQPAPLPTDKPMILACNHPSGFIEPLILTTHLPIALHSITRGDMFAKPMIRRILESLHMIPIFRFVDGYSSLKNNQATFEKIYQVLDENKAILIFAEGRTIWEKRLRPIQKGTARMVFGANDIYHKEEILIVPVGINYTDITKFRSDVMVSFGEPLRMSDYLELYNENNNKAITKMTADISAAMAKELIIIDKVEDEPLVEKLFEIYRNDLAEGILPIFEQSNDRLHDEKHIAQCINEMPENEKLLFSTKVDSYFEQLQEAKITDYALVNPPSHRIWSYLVIIIGFLPFILGYIINYIPYKIGKRTADTKVKSISFYAPVAFSVGLLIYLIQFLIILIILTIFLGWHGLLWATMLPVWSYFSLVYKEYFVRTRKSNALRRLNEAEIFSLRKLRFSISSKINQN